MRSSGILNAISTAAGKTSTCFTDGAKAYKAAGECKFDARQVRWEKVSHQKSQFTKKVRKTAGVRKAGTQQLDRIWHHVKKSIPRTLKNRDPQGYLNQKDLMKYVHQWQWRRSCDSDLFTSLGQACKKLHR